ncbi:MAG TPA: hypothetical protein VFH27_15490 [Longimicrobiaceae bacterium]|nr:hypothetical protein [Longimicrobiaceae bacterium]
MRTLDALGFRAWLGMHVERWQRDPVFVQRSRIRDLRRAHPQIRAAERDERRARRAYEQAPEFAELSRIEKALDDAGKAVAGLTAAAAAADREERARLAAKQAEFTARQAALRAELKAGVEASAARRAWDRAVAVVAAVHAEAGLPALEEALREAVQGGGRKSSGEGARFEDVAETVIRTHLLPELAAACACDAGELRILRGVTLGAAGIEIDHLVVHRTPESGEVKAVAVVEAKRNINDIAHGFQQRQQNLAWLAGDTAAYDPQQFRTRTFPTGHFDRPAVHEQDGEQFAITRSSFSGFTRDPATGHVLDGLYLVTRPGWLWGIGSSAMTRLAHRASTDERWAPEDDAYLHDLLGWLREMSDPSEAPDVLAMYAARPGLASRIVLVQS